MDNATSNQLGRPRLSFVVFLVRRRLMANKSLAFLNIVLVSLAVLQVLVLSYFAKSAFDDSARTIKDANLATRVIAKLPPDLALDETLRFTDERILAIKQENSDISQMVGIVARGCGFRVDGGNSLTSYFEGVVPQDPEFVGRDFIWGKTVSCDDSLEIVLTEPLFNALCRKSGERFSIESGKDIPEFVWIETSRSANGKEQQFRRRYRLVGVLDSQTKYAYIPYRQAVYINMWCDNQIDEIPDSSGTAAKLAPKLGADKALAFISSKIGKERLDEVSQHYGISLKSVGNYEDLSSAGVLQFRLAKPDGADFSSSDVSTLKRDHPGLGFYPVRVVSLDLSSKSSTVTIVAVDPSDPRLQEISVNDIKEAQEIISKPGHALISSSGLRALGYSSIAEAKVLRYGDPRFPTVIYVDGLSYGSVGSFSFDLLVSLETLDYFSKEPELVEAYLIATTSQHATGVLSKSSYKFRAEIWQEEKPVKDSEQENPGVLLDKSSSDYWSKGSYDGLDTKASDIPLSSGSDTFTSDFPSWTLAAVHCNQDELKQLCRQLKDPALAVASIWVLPQANGPSRIRHIAFVDDQALNTLPFGWAFSCPSRYNLAVVGSLEALGSRSEVKINGIEFKVSAVDNELFPDSYLFMRRGALSKYDLFFGQGYHPSFYWHQADYVDVTLQDVWSYDQTKDQFVAKGFSVKDLCFVERTPITCYQVSSKDKAKPEMDESLLAFLKNDQTFLDVMPIFSFEAAVKGLKDEKKASFFASHSQDHRRFLPGSKLIAGSWINNSPTSVVLPASLFEGISDTPAQMVGQVITLHLKKEARSSDGDPDINVDCTVSGVVEGKIGYLQLELAKNISLWHLGKIKHTTRQGFISGEEIQRGTGQYSSKVLAVDIASVPKVVSYLRSLGYETKDALGGQQHVNRLGKVLAFLVILLVIGSIAGAFVAVTLTTLMNTKNNIYEPAGIYPSLGGTKALTLKIFTLHGIVLGTISFLVALVSSWFVVEGVKSLVKIGFNFPIDQITRHSILSGYFWWLHLGAFATSLAFCLVGVWFSAALVCRTSIAQAFNSKDQ